MGRSDFDDGFVLGLLATQGSFGGDGRQPQVTLRLHTRHLGLLEGLTERFPGSRVYGPYDHGGRSYAQWMARGPALVAGVLPLLEAHADRVPDAAARIRAMTARYEDVIARERARAAQATE